MEPLDARRERAARNQSLFREVNERIAALSQRYSAELGPNAYLCECLDATCTETLQLTQHDYETLRASGNRFFVMPGHEDPTVEEVTDETAEYLIVAKLGVGGELAEALNPRKAGQPS